MRAYLAIRYILGEMIPTFFLGVIVFVLILLMFQALRLTELLLVHGVKLTTIGQIMSYLSVAFLPILFPMSLLFAVLLTYSRLSADSEIVAFRSVGLSMITIITPAIILSVLVGIISLQTSYHLAPWGNRQFEILVRKIGSQKPGVTIKEGTFSKDFFELVVYANKVDSVAGKLSQVFIYDEHQQPPSTIIAADGKIEVDPDHPGESALLQLNNGSIHRDSGGRHTKIDFTNYKVYLSDPITESLGNKSSKSYTIDELKAKLLEPNLEKDEALELHTEFHTRNAISFACLLFALIGVGLGTVANRRNAKSGGMVICIGLIAVYWIMYVICEGASRQGKMPASIAMWIPNAIFTLASAYSLRQAWR